MRLSPDGGDVLHPREQCDERIAESAVSSVRSVRSAEPAAAVLLAVPSEDFLRLPGARGPSSSSPSTALALRVSSRTSRLQRLKFTLDC